MEDIIRVIVNSFHVFLKYRAFVIVFYGLHIFLIPQTLGGVKYFSFLVTA